MSGVATQAIRRTEGDLQKWLVEVLDGTGSSPAQMIITVVLGCIPYVGQALDARNIIIAIVALADEPDESEKWLDLVLALIALVPVFGDALKNVFKLLRLGRPLGRILDSLPNQLRGNVERWFRALDWAQYARDLNALTDTLLARLIDMLDGWVTRAVMGNARVRQVVAQLRRLEQLAQRKIDEAMHTLQTAYERALGQPLPATAAAGPAGTHVPRPAPPGSAAPGNVKRPGEGNYTPAQGQGGGTHRQSPRRGNAGRGDMGEHICDYYFVRRNHARTKVSNRGMLWEAVQNGHPGIDHVWHGGRLPFGYRVTDTKSTGNPRHRLMTPSSFFSNARMGIDVLLGWDDEGSVRNATPGPTVGDGKELSHTWVVRKMGVAGITPQHWAELGPAIQRWRREFSQDAAGRWRLSGHAPYDRSFVAIVGANLSAHNNSSGGDIPRCTRPVRAHQIAAEFILPTEMYFE